MILPPGVEPKLLEFTRRENMAGEPVLKIHGLSSERELETIYRESFIIFWDNIMGEDYKRFFMVNLLGEILLFSEPCYDENLEKFKELLHNYSGWYYIDLVTDKGVVELQCNGYMDFTGTFPDVIESFYHGTDVDKTLAEIDNLLLRFPKMKYARIFKYLLEKDRIGVKKAIRNVIEELSIYPSEFAALNILGNYYYEIEKYERARVFMSRSLAISPYNEKLLLKLGDIAVKQNKIEDYRSLMPRLYCYSDLKLETQDNCNCPSPELIKFFNRTESIFRKSAFGEVKLLVEEKIKNCDERSKKFIKEWASYLLAIMPEKFSPFSLPPIIEEIEEFLDNINKENSLVIYLNKGKFLNAVVEKYESILKTDYIKNIHEKLMELHDLYPERVEFSSYCAKIIVLLCEDSIKNNREKEIDKNIKILKEFLKKDKCVIISSYTVISLLSALIDKLFRNSYCCQVNAEKNISIIWKALTDILLKFPEFANYTPLFMSLKRWTDEGDSTQREIVRKMIDDIKNYMKQTEDDHTLKNINKAMSIARFTEYL